MIDTKIEEPSLQTVLNLRYKTFGFRLSKEGNDCRYRKKMCN